MTGGSDAEEAAEEAQAEAEAAAETEAEVADTNTQTEAEVEAEVETAEEETGEGDLLEEALNDVEEAGDQAAETAEAATEEALENTEEAAEMGLKLGDTMTINILGRDITGTIASFREVDFSTAGMGFIMVMNQAALEAAPHTFIATVYADEAAEAAIFRDLSDSYPNITAIRVRDAIDQVSDLLAGLASATAWGAAATLLTGFLVLIGAAAADQRSRSYEAAILKTLGATRARILAGLTLRSALLGMAAGVVALGAGIAGGWAVSHYVMETGFEIAWGPAVLIVAGGAVISLLAGLAFALGPVSAKPARVLRAQD